VNALALGLLGPLAGWLVFLALRRASERVAAFAAAWVAVQVSTGLIALVLGLQHHLAPGYFPMPFAVTAAAMLAPSLAVTGVVEGLYTVFALSVLRRTRLAVLS
jgi:cobalt/nickel transport system permease protein